jgi:hypothetical protein
MKQVRAEGIPKRAALIPLGSPLLEVRERGRLVRTLWLERPPAGIGIQLVDPHRQQPFSVWYRGQIHYFCATRTEAEGLLAELQTSPPAVEELE